MKTKEVIKQLFYKYFDNVLIVAILTPVFVVAIIVYNRRTNNEMNYYRKEFSTVTKSDLIDNEIVLSISTPEHFRTAGLNAYVLLNKSGKKAIFIDTQGPSFNKEIKLGSILFKDSNSLELRVQNINQKDTITYFFNLYKTENNN